MTQVRRLTLGGQLFEVLRLRILSGEMSAGSRVIQDEVAGEFGVSRIPTRDALKRLESEGLLRGDEIGRYTVASLSSDDAVEVYAIRRRLEPLAGSLAASRATDVELAQIGRLLEETERAGKKRDASAYVELNRHFHMAIYEASRAPRLVRMIRTLWSGVIIFTPISAPKRIPHSNQEHRALFDRLLARDAEGVAAALERHVANAEKEYFFTIRKQARKPSSKRKGGKK
jgi:DNA-binding GntR family transcriptional regulator